MYLNIDAAKLFHVVKHLVSVSVCPHTHSLTSRQLHQRASSDKAGSSRQLCRCEPQHISQSAECSFPFLPISGKRHLFLSLLSPFVMLLLPPRAQQYDNSYERRVIGVFRFQVNRTGGVLDINAETGEFQSSEFEDLAQYDPNVLTGGGDLLLLLLLPSSISCSFSCTGGTGLALWICKNIIGLHQVFLPFSLIPPIHLSPTRSLYLLLILLPLTLSFTQILSLSLIHSLTLSLTLSLSRVALDPCPFLAERAVAFSSSCRSISARTRGRSRLCIRTTRQTCPAPSFSLAAHSTRRAHALTNIINNSNSNTLCRR